jgi:ankyrin repeat protein
LAIAASKNHEGVVSLLLDRGADVRSKAYNGRNTLIAAAYNNYESMVSLLLDRGADIDSRNNNGDTALMVAALRGHSNILILLVKYGADIYSVNKVFHLIFTSILLKFIYLYFFIFSLLLKRGQNTIDILGAKPFLHHRDLILRFKMVMVVFYLFLYI